ncbi:MAG: DUF1304 family protein [Methyloligellaceae bacterium]
MKFITLILVLFVILFHIGVFVAESFLWMQPFIHEFAIEKLKAGVNVEVYDQALVLKKLFYNQGFYNLFLALGGVAGLIAMARGKVTTGCALIMYMCLFATGAGLILAISAQAYIGAFMQGGVAAMAFLMVAFGGLGKAES